MNRWVIIIIALVVVGAGLYFWRSSAAHAKAATPYRMAVVDRGNVQTQVTATGTVSAVTTVQVGSQVSGTIKNLYVDFNSPVKKGEVVARLDPTFLQAAVNESNANKERAQATLSQAERDMTRTQDLFDKKLASQADFDNARTAVDVAKAGLAQAQAQLDRAKINLTYAVITSPTDGVVISRSVDVGQTVAASLQAPTLFTIAQDLREMQIETDIDEADIGGLKEGMEATFTVDAFPDQTFQGQIQQIRYAAQTNSGVVTYPVIISVSNPDLKLRPGMTANVTIVTAERDDVLRAPSVALRFRPADAPAAKKDTMRAVRDTTRAVRDTTRGAMRDSTGAGRGAGGRGQWRGRSGDHAGDGSRRMSTLWVRGKDGKPEPRQVSAGLNDGNHVEIISGQIAPGDSVIVGTVGGTAATNANSNRMPGFGGPGMGGGGPRR
ncbi:MAG TPA: efflux RND transporter periplasmic adaptor subunit [bacterium]|jgi:HlyD family secretion protein